MRPASADLVAVLASSLDWSYEADLYYGEERLFRNLPVDDLSLRWDATADIEGSGSCRVVWTDAQGSSLKPNDPQDWLAPFGSRLVIFAKVSVGSFVERIQLGVFTLTSVPRADDQAMIWGETRITVSSVVDVEFKDRMVEVQRDRFTVLSQPASTDSVYAELANLTGFQLRRTIADAPITRSVVYEESRIKALQDLSSIVDGRPFMESDGTLSLRPISPGSPVAALTIGESGTIVQVGSTLDSDGVYNGVIIRGETDGQQAILAERWIEDGPLRATPDGGERTPFHRVPRMYSSPFITTQEQAEKAAPGLLIQFSGIHAAQLEVSCIVDPRLQVGDVVAVNDGEAVWAIRLVTVALSGAGRMKVSGDVLSRVPYEYDAVVSDLDGFGEGLFGDGRFGF